MGHITWKSQDDIEQEKQQTEHDAKMAITVSRAQGKIVLLQQGLWDHVVSAVDNIEDKATRQIAQTALHEAPYWTRGSVTMQTVSEAIGVTEEQMDDLFAAAQAVEL